MFLQMFNQIIKNWGKLWGGAVFTYKKSDLKSRNNSAPMEKTSSWHFTCLQNNKWSGFPSRSFLPYMLAIATLVLLF